MFLDRLPANRSSLTSSNELVKRVEAALATTELTPPRSSPESPDRASSPESECGLVIGDRDVMSLPLRKRKLYLKEEDPRDVAAAAAAAAVSQEHEQSQQQRQSSVIQFAKSSS